MTQPSYSHGGKKLKSSETIWVGKIHLSLSLHDLPLQTNKGLFFYEDTEKCDTSLHNKSIFLVSQVIYIEVLFKVQNDKQI